MAILYRGQAKSCDETLYEMSVRRHYKVRLLFITGLEHRQKTTCYSGKFSIILHDISYITHNMYKILIVLYYNGENGPS